MDTRVAVNPVRRERVASSAFWVPVPMLLDHVLDPARPAYECASLPVSRSYPKKQNYRAEACLSLHFP